jgi:fumarylacetoacetase
VSIGTGSRGFTVQNLPYCSFVRGSSAALGVRIGDRVLNISRCEAEGLLDAGGALAGESTLNRFMAQGRRAWTRVRAQLTDLLTEGRVVEPWLVDLDRVRLNLPFTVADYVDFYSSEHHAANLGRILRPGTPPLLPNWRHLPVGYHGRAGTVVVSGTPIRRPRGQLGEGRFGPSQRLDIEAELGFVVGVGSAGPIGPDEFREHVFGAVLVNDWSARDIQAWEYRPLGPFLGKSFATSVSPWVVPLEALDAARVPAPPQDPPVLDYLREADRFTYDVSLEVSWNGTPLTRPPFAQLYWTPAQQLAHMTVNGAPARPGDLFASGTISGAASDEVGSFIEMTSNGAQPVRLANGATRTFLHDGDTVSIAGFAPGAGGAVVGFGEVTGTIVSG